jgi:hypothetical protein
MPIAVPRSAGAKDALMIESVAGIITAAPTPWKLRAAIRKSALGARRRRATRA